MVDLYAMRASTVVHFALACGIANAGWADIVCPDSSYVQVDYACTFTGSYRTGEPKDVITVSPDGSGETFAENGISIRVYLRNCQGEPVAGVPRESIALRNLGLCACPGGTVADAPTDAFGMTTFSGTLKAGGCTLSGLDLEVERVKIATVQVRTNSPDDFYAWPCVVSGDERAKFSAILTVGVYNHCFDFNEDGKLDIVDWAIFMSRYDDAWCGFAPSSGDLRR